MKILLIETDFPTDKNPHAGSHAKRQYDALVSLGHQVKVLTTNSNKNGKYEQLWRWIKLNIRVFFTNFKKYDWVMCNHVNFYWPATQLKNCRNVAIIIHGSELNGNRSWLKFRNFQKYLKPFNRCRLIITNSYRDLKRVNSIFGNYFIEHKGVVNPSSAVNTDIFKSMYLDTAFDKKVIGFASRVTPMKGTDVLQHLIEQHPDKVFMIIGYGDPKLIEKFAAQDNVVILPKYKYEELPKFYNQIDLLIMPTKMESLGNVVPEALACGTPCIVPEDFAFPEYFRDEIDGLMIEDTSIDGWSKAVDKAINNLESYNPAINSTYTKSGYTEKLKRILT